MGNEVKMTGITPVAFICNEMNQTHGYLIYSILATTHIENHTKSQIHLHIPTANNCKFRELCNQLQMTGVQG